MKRIAKYQKRHAELRQQMEGILAKAEASGGDLTAEQQAEYDSLKAERSKVEQAIEREKELEASERTAGAVAATDGDGSGRITRVVHRADRDPARGFTSHLDFIMAAMDDSGHTSRDNVTDERLKPLALVPDDKERRGRAAGSNELAFMLPVAFTPRSLRAAVGSDEHGEYDDSRGGLLVTPSYLPGMLALGFEGDPTAGRTQPLPMASPTVKIAARTDKDHTTSVSGGLTVGRRAETVAANASRMAMEQITMSAASLFGLSYATEELLADSPVSFAAMLAAGFSDQFAHEVLKEKLRGAGGDQYLGILTGLASTNLGPTIAIDDRAVTSHLRAIDAINMRARCWGYGQAIWLANHDAYPDISKMAIVVSDEGATPVGGVVSIYQPSLTEDRPDMLLGRPIFYTEYASTLGTPGDLILSNWSQYLEGIYQPLQSAESVHVRFVNHERAFKFWLRNCGAPWWRTPLTPNQSNDTLSPFVIAPA